MSMCEVPDAFTRQIQRYDPVFDVDVVHRALAEDVGRGDVTTEATISEGRTASARIVTREAGVVAGLPLAGMAFRLLDPMIALEMLVTAARRWPPETRWCASRAPLAPC